MWNRMSGLKVLWLGSMVAMGVVGCGQNRDRLAYDNFTQIKTQVSSREEVVAILGEPDHRLDDRYLYERPDKHLHVIVEFDDKGRVTRTQWIDGLGETWHDTDEPKPQ